MDASLKGLGAVLSQQDSYGDQWVISFASRSLKPYEKSMRSYSSAKLELLALKWAVCDKSKDYLLGSKFTVLMDNNPLCYVKTSKLGVSQIRWLSNLALFDFDIKYWVGRKKQVADTLSHHPLNPDSSSESEDDDDNWETISYGMVCQSINHLTNSYEDPVPCEIWDSEQWNGNFWSKQNYFGKNSKTNLIQVQLNELKLFSSIPISKMGEEQWKDPLLTLLYELVQKNSKPKLSQIHQIRSKLIRKMLLQFDRFSLIEGVLHCQAILHGEEVQQLVLPHCFQTKVLKSIHDNSGHQGLEKDIGVVTITGFLAKHVQRRRYLSIKLWTLSSLKR